MFISCVCNDHNEPSHEKTNSLGFRPVPTQTAWSVQSQREARSLRFWVKVEKILNYLCSENKGADQLCSYCTADLHLCFPRSILFVFSCSGSIISTLMFLFIHVPVSSNKFNSLPNHPDILNHVSCRMISCFQYCTSGCDN